MLPGKQSRTQHFGLDTSTSDADERARKGTLEAKEQIQNMEREAQKMILEQQQAFKYQQHHTEHQAYLALERQQQDAERQLAAQMMDARREEAVMVRKVGEVEIRAVQSEHQKEKKECSREYDELREYAVRLELAAEAEVQKESQAQAQEARERIESVIRQAEQIHRESVTHSQAATSAIRTEQSQVAVIRRQLQTK